MNNHDMRQPPSRCSSSSSIPTQSTCLSNGHHHLQPPYHGKYPPFEYPRNRTSLNSAAQATPRKDVTTNSIFSFLQRFRAKNRSIFDDANSLPSSPRSSRVSRTGYRWESVESVLSSATASSFAFIPPYHHQQPSTRIFHKASRAPPAPSAPPINLRTARENCAFLRKKYNLHGSDATLYRHSRESIAGLPANVVVASKSDKRLHRNSVGNVENLAARWQAEEVHSGNRVRPYSEGNDTLQVRRSHCHRPGKRRAPQPPPTTLQLVAKVHRRPSNARKKRKAPSPPKVNMSDGVDKVADYTGAVYNDSLKLERGVLKANKEAVASSAASSSEASSVPVSPKPWYKRSATQPNLRSVSKSEKKKSCEQLLDEWMLEAGLPRSTSFYERKLTEPLSSPGVSSESGNPKRRSQISMLANISELDREAAEIVQQERKREREVAHSMDNKFYIGSSSVTLEPSPIKVTDTGTTSKRTTPKDLISILNAITNVTKITVNNTFFKETLTKSSSSGGTENKPTRALKSPDRQDRLTITELEDFDKETKKSSVREPVTSVQIHPEPQVSPAKRPTEPVKPVKPFSNWMCPQCTLENPSWKFICEACNKWRPYSVNRLPTATAKVTPKDDINLKVVDKSSANSEDISRSVREKVHEMLASEQSLTSKAINDLLQPLPPTTPSAAQEVASANGDFQFCDNIDEVRKARLAFFTKNRLNDLNIVDEEKGKPCNSSNAEAKNKCYSEEDRRKLREILKELKDSLPKSDLVGDKSSKRKVTVHSTKEDMASQAESKKISNIDRSKAKDQIKIAVQEEPKKISNICGVDPKPPEKVEAYFITTTTVIEESPISEASTTKVTEKIELQVPVIEHKVGENGEVSANMIGVEGIRINTKDLELVATKPEGAVYEGNVNMLEPTIEKSNQNDDQNLATDWKQNNSIAAKENKNLTSITVNRLLKKLQTAIANGQHHEAANIARDLARLKVNCNMTRQDTPDTQAPPRVDDIQNISVDIHVHEKHVPRDQIRLKINPQTTINELQTKISKEHGIPVTDQQLIFGKHPITDASATLDQIGVNSNGMIMFLKVSNSENEASTSAKENKLQANHGDNAVAGTSQQHISDKMFDKVPNPNSKSNISDFMVHTTEDKPAVNESKTCDSSAKIPGVKDKEDLAGPSEGILLNDTAEWVCAICTLINEEKAKLCAACGRIRQENPAPRVQDIASKASSDIKKEIPIPKPSSYHELMDLEKTDLISNVEAFDCEVCLTPYEVGEGVVLKDCLHTFCRHCLSQTIEHCAEAEVKCPFRDAEYSCESVLQEREIKALVNTETFEKHLARSVAEAENKIKNAFHCKTANCRGWCIFEDNVNEFHCPVCSQTNCLTCQVIHSGLNCKQYQEVINKESETNADANRTRLMLQEMLQKGEAMTCPTCEVILMKKWGCDWLRCSMCKTEICWVTRGPRWGPKGKGDTSGGCRCGVNGVKCHQKCTFCH